MSAQTPPDDLDALRAVIDAVKDFDQADQKRIIRWAAEKLLLPEPFARSTPPPVANTPPPAGAQPPAANASPPAGTPPLPPTAQDIRSFVTSKSPRSDVQFAATVAYYYRFEAAEAERKEFIKKDDLQDACRTAGRTRLVNPGQTLINAQTLGLLDKTPGEPGGYSVNTVGENLVAMTLPGDGAKPSSAGGPKRKKAVKKKAAKKKAAKKKTTGKA